MNNEKTSTGALVLLSIGLIVCGIIILSNPLFSYVTLFIFLGAMALARGIMLIITFFKARDVAAFERFGILMLGILLLILGMGFLFAPAFMTKIFAYLLAIWFIFDGIAGLFGRKHYEGSGKLFFVIHIIMCIIILAGGVMLLFNPWLVAIAIPIVIGINVIAMGFNSMILAMATRKENKQLKKDEKAKLKEEKKAAKK